MLKAQVIRSTGSWYEVEDATGSQYSARLRGRHKLKSKRYTNPIAVGDYVYLEKTDQDDWVIDRVEDRKQFLVRRSSNLSRKYHVIASNIDQMFLFVTVNHPHTPLGFVNRIMVMAEKAEIPITLVINKMDLYDDKDLLRLEEIVSTYESIGYECIMTSFKDNIGLDLLVGKMENKLSLVVGNSGVGKTTFLNLVVPNALQKTSEISDSYGKGRHTTTFATMFTANNIRIIDTPGIKEFGLVDIESSELSQYFPEIWQASHECKFNNCMHLQEPDCEVLRRLVDGEISDTRYDAYCLMLEELKS